MKGQRGKLNEYGFYGKVILIIILYNSDMADFFNNMIIDVVKCS